MSPLWGPSRTDRERLLVTLRSLGPTSVAGLSAALSWSERRTERTVREIGQRREAALNFDPRDRSVAFAVPHGRRPSAPAPVVEGSIPPDGSSAPAAPSSAPVRSPAAAEPTVSPIGPAGNCDVCGVRMVPTGTGRTLYCPECGRLASARKAAVAPSLGAPTSVPTLTPSPTPILRPHPTAPPSANDRRAQEMFAAWVTSQPIPCPRCRTPLKHRGVAEYACPACGERVHFTASKLPTTSAPTAAPAPPAPASP